MGNIVERYAFYPPDPIQHDYIHLTTGDGDKIPIIYLENPNSNYVIIYSHGNATDIGRCREFINLLYNKLNVSILAYDYLGYGHSIENTISYSTITSSAMKLYPSEQGCYKSIEAVYRYLIYNKRILPKRIILLGQSLGTGPTLELASKSHIGAVILVSPFLSCVKVYYDTNLLYPIDIFCNEYKIDKVNCPILIVHGTDDKIVDISHAERLYEIARNENKQISHCWIRNAGHNDICDNNIFYNEAIRFITSYINKKIHK